MTLSKISHIQCTIRRALRRPEISHPNRKSLRVLAVLCFFAAFTSIGNAAEPEPPPRDIIMKSMQQLGRRVQQARQCGYSETHMPGALALYRATVSFVSVFQDSRNLTPSEKALYPTTQDVNGSFMTGAQVVSNEPKPTVKNCANLSSRWPEYEKLYIKMASQASSDALSVKKIDAAKTPKQ